MWADSAHPANDTLTVHSPKKEKPVHPVRTNHLSITGNITTSFFITWVADENALLIIIADYVRLVIESVV